MTCDEFAAVDVEGEEHGLDSLALGQEQECQALSES
jgi:hypothetical protein